MIGPVLLVVLALAPATGANRVDAPLQHEKFESAAACEARLRLQHAEATKGLAALPDGQRRLTRLGALAPDAAGKLGYAVRSEFAVDGSGVTIPNVMNHEYSCDGASFVHRSYVLIDMSLPPAPVPGPAGEDPRP